MKLVTIQNNPFDSLIYMERYVNDGSPSGFSEKYNTSSFTNPFGRNDHFKLPFLDAKDKKLSDYGDLTLLTDNLEFFTSSIFFVHPDMLKNDGIKGMKVHESDLKSYPTSSSRTILVVTENVNFYLKLHYDGIIGRINRSLPFTKAISGFENSNIIEAGINKKIYPEYFGIFREIGLRTLTVNNNGSWSFVLRESIPFKTEKSTIFIVPFFSIFSKDRLDNDCSLLTQLSILYANRTTEIVVELIIKRIIECYFLLILNEGLQFELNAQNVLIGFDENFIPTSIIFRDLMGIEKDITIRNSKYLLNDFLSAPYKYISKEQDEVFYKIRHSFAFDFKLSKYIVEPLLSALKSFSILNIDIANMNNTIKDYCKLFIDELDKDYFPSDGKWYYHENVLLTGERIYLESNNPIYR